MKIDRHNLQSALEIVKPGLANREMIEQTTSFAFLGDRVVTYNDHISISHPIENLDIKGAVRSNELYEFLKRSTNKDLHVKLSDKELLLKSGRSKAGLTLMKEIVLPLDEVNAEKEWHDLPEEFTHNLMFVKDNASTDRSQMILNCVHVTPRTLETSNGLQIMKLYLDDAWPLDNYLIPAETVPEIHKIEPTQVAESHGWLHFRNMNLTEISVRIFDDEYPEVDAHFEVKGEELVFPDKMDDILSRARVFTEQDHNLDEQMEIRVKDGALLVHGKNQYAWFKEQAKVKYNGEPTSFWITPSLLANILDKSSTCILGTEKLRFEGEGWEYVAVLRQD